MAYPTMKEVEQASRVELGNWSRFLASPGAIAIERIDFEAVMQREKAILDRILERFQELGGWNVQVSKRVGW